MTARIVIVRAGALGDTILTLPAVGALRRRFPDADIEVIGYPTAWSVAGRLVDAVHEVDDPLYAGLFSPSASYSAPPETDLLVIWSTRDPVPVSGGAMTVSASPYPQPGVHAAAWLLSTLTDVGIDGSFPAVPSLHLTAAELTEGENALRDLGLTQPILIHPSAGALWKRWPAARFAAVAARLRAEGREVALIAGPADDDTVRGVLEHIMLPVLRALSPRRLGAVLAHGALYLGNDSGVSHLAAASGTRTVALFGPTDPVMWAPLGDVAVIRRCGCIARVQGDVRVCGDPECMSRISEEEVMEVIERELQSPVHPYQTKTQHLL